MVTKYNNEFAKIISGYNSSDPSLRPATRDRLQQHNPTPSWSCQGPVDVSSPRMAEEDGMGDVSGDVLQVSEVRVEEREPPPPQESSSREGPDEAPKARPKTSLLAQLIRCDPVIVIREMILSSPSQKLRLREIIALLEERHPQLRGRKDWEGKVRHHLSVKREFCLEPALLGNFSYWVVDMNQTGNRFRGKSKPKKKTAAPPTATNPRLPRPRIQRRYGSPFHPDNAGVLLTRAPAKTNK